MGGIDAWSSQDGGASLQKISDWVLPWSSHADHHAIVSPPYYDGGANRYVYFGNDGGVYRKDDIFNTAGLDWVNLCNGLKATQYYKGAIQSGTNYLLGGTQDNGTSQRGASNSWGGVDGGDGGFCAYDASGSGYYWEYVYLTMYKNGPGFRIPCHGGIGDATNQFLAPFIAPFKADPALSGRLFAGAKRIWRSMDGASNWTQVRDSISTRSMCSAIELTAAADSLVWIGYEDGTVSRSSDNGAT